MLKNDLSEAFATIKVEAAVKQELGSSERSVFTFTAQCQYVKFEHWALSQQQTIKQVLFYSFALMAQDDYRYSGTSDSHISII